ncbi:MAG: type II toxin-antitoxin system prevent-host-death family antitoxin [Actinomycetia bacterium]|nr:type II toxin-antitoxin system prevent-host-death family antitoxin [Actinomycetes bacterium]
MREIDIQEFQMNAPRVIAVAEAGESITITDRGRPVALLGPIRPSRIDALIKTGATTLPSRRLVDLPPPAPRASGQSTLSEIVDEQRADRI